MVTGKSGKFWKYLGAMMTEPKGGTGEQAASFTRVLGIVLFACCLAIWLFQALGCQGTAIIVPEGMLWTLWGLIGIKGARDVAQGLGKKRDH